MKEEKDIRDDEIRIIGDYEPAAQPSKRNWLWVCGVIAVLVAVVAVWAILHSKCNEAKYQEEPSYFESTANVEPLSVSNQYKYFGSEVDSLAQGFCEIRDTMINDVPLRLFIPHNAQMSLHIGKMDLKDSTVIYAAQAADVRADNGKIVGAFVLAGEPKSWGLSKKGFCASIDGKVTVGVAENSPLFEQATEQGGYFFRQYPLVADGQLVENNPKNKSERRAICDRYGEIFMVETLSKESFHDFSQALVDLGVDNAVYLVGSNAYGWAVSEDGSRHEFGVPNYYRGRYKMPANTSYIVWRRE